MLSALTLLALRGMLYFALHFENNGVFPKQLSKKDEKECIEKIAEGDECARNKLIVHNQRLVAFIVKKNYSDYRDQDDLISIGTIGLIRAVETFDYSKGIHFSTYASTCIDNQIRMFFRKNKNANKDIYIYEAVTYKRKTGKVPFIGESPVAYAFFLRYVVRHTVTMYL